jgi:hypothetical protein
MTPISTGLGSKISQKSLVAVAELRTSELYAVDVLELDQVLRSGDQVPQHAFRRVVAGPEGFIGE